MYDMSARETGHYLKKMEDSNEQYRVLKIPKKPKFWNEELHSPKINAQQLAVGQLTSKELSFLDRHLNNPSTEMKLVPQNPSARQSSIGQSHRHNLSLVLDQSLHDESQLNSIRGTKFGKAKRNFGMTQTGLPPKIIDVDPPQDVHAAKNLVQYPNNGSFVDIKRQIDRENKPLNLDGFLKNKEANEKEERKLNKIFLEAMG